MPRVDSCMESLPIPPIPLSDRWWCGKNHGFTPTHRYCSQVSVPLLSSAPGSTQGFNLIVQFTDLMLIPSHFNYIYIIFCFNYNSASNAEFRSFDFGSASDYGSAPIHAGSSVYAYI